MNPLANLALAAATFVCTHLLLSHPFRKTLVRRVGERGFLGIYSLVALASFGWLVWARMQAPAGPLLWIAPLCFWDVATVLTLFAAILLVGSLRGNPALVNPAGRMRAPDRALGVYAITRHPMMWAFILWAAVHIILWGSVANLLLAGAILLLALAGSLGQDAKKRRLLGPDWIEWRRKTAYLPFGGQVAGRLRWGDARPGAFATIGGIILWLVATWGHAPAGASLAGAWRWFG